VGLVLFDPFWLWTPGYGSDSFVRPTTRPPLENTPIGGLQLDVEPRRAQVYANGWYVGVVDDFSGYYRHLEIAAGSHAIDIVADGYEPLTIEVVVSPGRTTTYRATLNRAPGRN